ncbi:MAG: hypothetical protein MR286_03605 [Clostridiales bacterium]|nr:hypothetical protein [Clostridiales bacterium]
MGQQRGKPGKAGKTPLTRGERRRLCQLLVCLVLFGAVFVGRGLDLEPVTRITDAIGTLIERDTDFQAVFAQVGESFSRGEAAVETFRALWGGEGPETTQEKEGPAEEGGEDRGETGS